MSARKPDLVLRCELCNKPFDKQSTLKRHGYYCRSRKDGILSRSRSCASCARAKARCDNKQPACSRCTTKVIECHYPKTPQVRESKTLRNGKSTVTAASIIQERSQGQDENAGVARIPPNADFADLAGGWGDLNIDFSNFAVPHPNNENDYPSPLSLPLVHKTTVPLEQFPRAQQSMFSPFPSIPPVPSYNVRSLVLRSKVGSGGHRITNLILHTLKSYPKMMRHNDDLPPFIHPSLILLKDVNETMEFMNNCINLVHMSSKGGQASRKLFWKNVRLECERICVDHPSLNKWELLAAMQALSIYILIRLDEGETEYNNFDFLLLSAVALVAKQLSAVSDIAFNTNSVFYNYDMDTNWKEWMYEESRRRLAIVYRVVAMLVYFEPSAVCNLQTDLILAPLPAKKQLWEARSSSAFSLEYQKEPAMLYNAYALAASGDLVKLEEGQVYGGEYPLSYKNLSDGAPERGIAHWEEWCAGMDGFGSLVMLAASLVG